MRRLLQIACILAFLALLQGCQETNKDKEKTGEKQAPQVEKITIPVLINVLKGVTGGEDKIDSAKMKRDLSASIKEASKILGECEVELELPTDGVQLDTPNPDGSIGDSMDANYADQKARDIEKKAREELKKKFNGDKKGFKIYVAGELKNNAEGEMGKGYWFEEPFSPGFSILTGDSAGSGRLMAHEIAHGLGCLKDLKGKDLKDNDDNLMKPAGRPAGDDTKLTPEQCKQLRECASQRKK